MLQKIEQSEAFKTDYKNYQSEISKITDKKLQEDCTDLLRQLKNTVVWIDNMHEQLFVTHQMPSDVSEARQKIISIKKQLDTRLKSYQNKKRRTL